MAVRRLKFETVLFQILRVTDSVGPRSPTRHNPRQTGRLLHILDIEKGNKIASRRLNTLMTKSAIRKCPSIQVFLK
jgi:hypothetical protein